jgi:hypothetical protein
VQWNFYQSHHPFAGQLQLPAGSLHFLQELNVGMGLQERVMPDALLVDASLARDALRMIDGGP